MDGGAWWATVHGVRKESDTTERLHFTSLPSLTNIISRSLPVAAYGIVLFLFMAEYYFTVCV